MYARMTRFTVNLQSVSFVLAEVPWAEIMSDSATQKRLEDSARIIKVRCTFPTVTFYESVCCLPTISKLTFEDEGGLLYVELEDFAQIVCQYAVVKIEKLTVEDYSIWTLTR